MTVSNLPAVGDVIENVYGNVYTVYSKWTQHGVEYVNLSPECRWGNNRNVVCGLINGAWTRLAMSSLDRKAIGDRSPYIVIGLPEVFFK